MQRSLPLILLLLITGITLFAQTGKKEKLSIESIWKNYEYRQQYVWGITPLPDGNFFSKIQPDYQTGTLDIIRYSIKTGDVKDTLFKGSELIPADSVRPVHFDDYTVSTDQHKIILATQMESIYRHSTREFNYVWNAETRSLTPLSATGKQMYASFSPDGNKVAYVVDNNLFYKDLETGKEVQVTEDGEKNKVINGATDWVYEEEFSFTKAFFWSPDSRRLAFYRFDESEVKQYQMPIYNGLYPEMYTFKYPKAGEKNSTVSIHVYDLENERTTEMETEKDPEQYIPRIKWTEDSELLSIQRMNRHQNKLELLLANVSSGETDIVLTEESEYYIEITDDLTFLEDGKHFIWTSEKSGYNHIYLYTLKGELVRQLTKGEWVVTSFLGMDEEDEIIYYESAEESPLQRHIYAVGLNGEGKKNLTPEKGTHRADFFPGYKYFIHYHSEANMPTVTTINSAEGKQVRILEENKGLQKKLKNITLSEKEFFTFKTSEGTQLNGWMIKPVDFDPGKEYPVFMTVYGGPGSQTVTDSWGGVGFIWHQYLANKGYIIVSVDNRGTGARGEEFKKMTYLNLGHYETIDQTEAAKYLAGLDYVDGERIGIFGWSYGGYMSSLALFKSSSFFKMAIAVAPVSHWKFYDTIYTERYMRTPQENPEGYYKSAPLNYVEGMEGKYLLIHGTADDNVHFQNSTELVKALVEAEKDFDVMYYPDKAHSISGGNTRFHIYSKMTDFILENL